MEANTVFPPAWFKIENYRGTKDFDARQWYEQLSRRQALFVHTDYVLADELGHDFVAQIWRIETAKKAECTRMKPVQPLSPTGLAAPESEPISDLRVFHLMKQADRDRDARRFGLCDAAATQRWRVIRNPQATYEQHKELAQLPVIMDFYDIRKPPQAVIQVDLGATDSALRAAFKEWLKRARSVNESPCQAEDDGAPSKAKRPRAENKSQRPPCDRWAKYQILPYIDLAIWAMETDTKVTWPMYAEVLSDGHYRTHEDIRKTTHGQYAGPLMRDLSKLKAFVGYGE